MKRKIALAAAAVPALPGLFLLLLPLDAGLFGLFAKAYTGTFVLLVAFYFTVRALERFLWQVGRRLALSYILIGVIPIPIVILMTLVVAYVVNGFFLGHLYRDAVHSLSSEVRSVAQWQYRVSRGGRVLRSRPSIPVSLAYYSNGRKLGGDPRCPPVWQEWWSKATVETHAPSPVASPFVAFDDGRPTLMAAAGDRRFGVLAVFDGDLELFLSQRAGIWVDLLRSDEENGQDVRSVRVLNQELAVRLPRLDRERPELRRFFYDDREDPSFYDRPSLVWGEISRPFVRLADGEPEAEHVAAALTASPRTLWYHLVSPSAEVDNFAYGVFFFLGVILFDLWVLAAAMALFMVFGLSRAVNQLSAATNEVQRGNFSARIDVRRSDQVGALQRSFNQMAQNLEELVSEATQKELLEKELEIARELQRSLLPSEVLSDDCLEMATYFAPSAAIGGDYYDVFRLRNCAIQDNENGTTDERIAIFVADVSGHGLSAGLRMAMVKSALQLLCEDANDPEQILRRIHRLQKERGFVTATLALLDRETGELVITNAGHSPTYLLRDREVREIVLPSTPLGALRGQFAQESVVLKDGDTVVWLSDGLIEAANADGELLGYEGICRSLEGVEGSATEVRDHLLSALRAHTGGMEPDDDQSVVVLSYRPDS